MPFDALEAEGRPTREDVASLVEELGLLGHIEVTKPIDVNADAGLYQVLAVPTVAHGLLLDKFLRAYLERFPRPDSDWQRRIRTGLESMLDAMFREETVLSLHPHVLKNSLSENSVTLTALTKVICAETDKNFGRQRSRIRKHIAIPLHDLLVWDVMETRRPHTSGSSVSFSIQLGEAARHYHYLVFKPLILKSLRAYLENLDR